MMRINIRTESSRLILILALLTFGLLYPFVPGKYDALAMPLFTLIQSIGLFGMLFVVLGFIWLSTSQTKRSYTNLFYYLGIFQAIILVLIAYFTSGVVLSILVAAVSLFLLIKIRNNLRKTIDSNTSSPAPLYLIFIPSYILLFSLVCAKPLTSWSRQRSIVNATSFIADIEQFKITNGFYPRALQAMYDDYFPQTIGVEKYNYFPHNDAYNISFEQPRFFLDVIGTREWLVYNPKDEHRVFSYTSWQLLLSPHESSRQQGWYASERNVLPHWTSFYFD